MELTLWVEDLQWQGYPQNPPSDQQQPQPQNSVCPTEDKKDSKRAMEVELWQRTCHPQDPPHLDHCAVHKDIVLLYINALN